MMRYTGSYCRDIEDDIDRYSELYISCYIHSFLNDNNPNPNPNPNPPSSAWRCALHQLHIRIQWREIEISIYEIQPSHYIH